MSDMAGAGKKELLRSWEYRLGLHRLSGRERWSLALAAVLLGLFLVAELLVLPFWQARASLQRSVAERKTELAQLVELSRQYRELRQVEQGVAESLARRGADFSLFAFVEQQAERAGARAQIDSIRPQATSGENGARQSTVEVRLQRIGLEPLVRFIGLVEAKEEGVAIRRLVIQESGGSGLLDASLQLIASEKER